MPKGKIIAFWLTICCISANSQTVSFTDAGSNYGFENIVAKQAFLCIQRDCFDGLKRTGFIDDSTRYDRDSIVNNLTKPEFQEFMPKGDYFYKFRVDYNISPLTFYRTFKYKEDSTIFLQLKLELAYKGGLLRCKTIEVFTENFYEINVESPWREYKMDRGSVTNIPFPPPPPPKPSAEMIYRNRGLHLCGSCYEKKEISIDENKKYWLWEKYSYDYIKRLGQKRYKVKDGGKLGLINNDNEALIPTIYDKIDLRSIGVYEVWQDGKVGLINQKFKETIPVNFDVLNVRIGQVKNKKHEGVVLLKKDKLWGVKDISGQEILPMKYDSIALIYSKFYKVKKEGKYGLLNFEGEEILPLKYSEIIVHHHHAYPLIYLIIKKRRKQKMLLFRENKIVQKVKLKQFFDN